MRTRHSRRARRAAPMLAVLVLLGTRASLAAGQLPGLPNFQGAFPAPGLAAGVDLGRASGRTMLAGAVGYAPRTGRFGLVAGVGAFGATAPGYSGSRVAYGARFALTAFRFAGERLAVTPFAGFGSTRGNLENRATAGLPPATGNATGTVQSDEIPLGVSAGWRLAVGTTRAVALSLSPAYTIYRRSGAGLDGTQGRLRIATVAELAVSDRIGVSLSGEFGQSGEGAEPGPRASRVGAGVSFRFAGRR